MAENDNLPAGTGMRGEVGSQCEAVLVYSTFPDLEAAERAGQSLIARKLAGCINILPGMVAIYAWKGAVERAQEAVLIAKTAPDTVEACMAAIVEGHPYEIPAILVLPVLAGSAAYLDWIIGATRT